jgi:hypothetical protein
MEEMKLIRAFRSQLLKATLRRETGHDANGPLDSYWIAFQNGRGETFNLHRGQLSELADLLTEVKGCLHDLDDLAEDARFHKAAEGSLPDGP